MGENEALLRLFQSRGLKTWHVVLMADIIGEKLAKAGLPPLPPLPEAPKMPEVVKVEIPKVVPMEAPKPQTDLIDLSDLRIEGTYPLLKLTVRGVLEELVAKSPSNNFSIHFSIDGKEHHKKFSELEEISEYVESIAAFKENDFYILSMKDISWLNTFSFFFIAHEPIVFKRIYASYTAYKT
jgi:hypothetical protein